MRCHRAKKLIYLWLEQDLDQTEKGDLLDHLRSCRACRLEWEEAKTSHLLWKDTLLGEDLPQISEQEFVEGVKKRIEEQKEPVREKPERPKVFSFLDTHKKFAYAVVAVILVSVSLWWRISSKVEEKIPKKDVVVHSAFINERKATFSIFESEDENIVFIWLEKS
jgi:hypothetical protein